MSDDDLLLSKNELLHKAVLGDVDRIVHDVVNMKDDLKNSVDTMLKSLALHTQHNLEASEKLQEYFSNSQLLAEQRLNEIVSEMVAKNSEEIRKDTSAMIPKLVTTISNEVVDRTTNRIADVTHELRREVQGMHESVMDAAKQVSWSWEKRLVGFSIALIVSLSLGLLFGRKLEYTFPAAYSQEIEQVIRNGEFLEAFWFKLDEPTQDMLRTLANEE